jgi:hypothetical protein
MRVIVLAALFVFVNSDFADEDDTTKQSSTSTRASPAPRVVPSFVKGLSNCDFCKTNRTLESEAKAAKSILVVRIKKSANAVKDDAGDGSLSRDYDEFSIVEGSCPAVKLVQEVARPDEGKCSEKNILKQNGVYRVSGVCEGRTFFLDACGLRKKLRGDDVTSSGAVDEGQRKMKKKMKELKKRVKRLKRERDELKRQLRNVEERRARAKTLLHRVIKVRGKREEELLGVVNCVVGRERGASVAARGAGRDEKREDEATEGR